MTEPNIAWLSTNCKDNLHQHCTYAIGCSPSMNCTHITRHKCLCMCHAAKEKLEEALPF